ncbi:serine protease [Crassaminicella profunda]|uniref:serine protease n=1 Tax=Crassaminicella profunda TaxID=1286698 RepID=UPI001CA6BB54|nr:serine protease [Crassaminicella profunda]QZY54776.1 trypsin-like peptidase domain-containing protein [Crassaminicella profunda]
MIIKAKPLKTIIMKTEKPFKDMKCTFNHERSQSLKGSLNKSVLFCRIIGMNEHENEYIHELKELDKYLQSMQGNYILFTKGLEKALDINEVEKMKRVMDEYMDFENQNYKSLYPLSNLNMGYEIKNECLEWTKKLVFKEIMDLYDVNNIGKSKTIRKNFGVKLLLWMNKYLKQLFENIGNMDVIHKVVFYGEIKEHELYFLILLSKIGCDVLYINPKEDIEQLLPQINNYSNAARGKKIHATIIPFTVGNHRKKINYLPKVQTAREEKGRSINFERKINKDHSNAENQGEKSYEEIARLAESVVMINVYDGEKQLIGRGSGVVISNDGFMITNFHVVHKGAFFGVVFENDENEYMTYNIIKYHTDYDLALIQVDRRTKPIEVNEKNLDLVRGQKIVTIGSPLGLFNTISDGIVSGFRNFDDIKMVQITAPISPGSSGGALINMYGKLVGITTSGLEGQNLNMAVPDQYIKQFAGNILNAI